jgi:hypothetical protein
MIEFCLFWKEKENFWNFSWVKNEFEMFFCLLVNEIDCSLTGYCLGSPFDEYRVVLSSILALLYISWFLLFLIPIMPPPSLCEDEFDLDLDDSLFT